MLSPYHCQVCPQSSLGLSSAEETANSFIGNAMLKAEHVAKHTEHAVLADDSGITVAALNGAPGIRSARYAKDAGSAQSNLDYLLSRLQTIDDPKPAAYFSCALAYLPPRTSVALPPPLLIESRWSGYLVRQAVGDHGFGYDPIFYVPERSCTAAQLSHADKNTMSHRARAMRQLLLFFEASTAHVN